MLPQVFNKTIQLPDGREIFIETGKLARQANGAVVVKCGQTMLLATVVSNTEAREGVDFLPLSVDYQEKFAAAGKIPGGFLKREGRLSDYEILTSRLVDRALRPIFPEDYHAETQVNIYLISGDVAAPPDALAALAASSAIMVSDIPFNGPISEVRVVRVDGELIINPSKEDIGKADIDLMIGATENHVIMVEGEMSEVSEDDMTNAIRFAHDAIKVQCQAQKELEVLVGKTEKRAYEHETHDEELYKRMHTELYQKAYEVASKGLDDKALRSKSFSEIKEAFVEQETAKAEESGEELNSFLIGQYFGKIKKEACRNATLKENKRLDGRAYDEIRPIWSEVNYLPSAHGSSIFTRGETQSLTTVTLGTKLDEQMIDGALHSSSEKFILHYNFPAFSTGEVRPNRGPGRREIGHGNLAFRALKKVVPADADNPYTIRVVSDILESNGSSSMATVCAGALALMDAGIQIKAPVSGIAMGLITNEDTGEYAVLSDILGDEDHLGDMDFKVTGTEQGITACQMDIKTSGLSYEVLIKALEQARQGRLHILGKMAETIQAPNDDLKEHAPRSVTMRVESDMIGAIIGPGGKVIQEMQKETETTIVIEEKDGAGWVNIFATNQKSMEAAQERIKLITAVPEVGEVYEGIVKTIAPYGAFIEFLPGKEGLLHISEIKWERLESMDGVMEVGEEVPVKLLDIDKKTGKFKLSRKVLLPKNK